MIKKYFVVLFFLIVAHSLSAQIPISFSGDPLTPFINQTVVFDQTLYVCGRYNHYLYLSYERLRQPEETAIAGSSAFEQDSIRCAEGILTVYCANVMSDTVRLGATITNLTGVVTNTRSLQVSGSIQFNDNVRPVSPPNVGDARLIICAANLQYYCPDWEGTYGAESDAEFQIQHTKLMKAFQNINADIYAVTEIQQGTIALQSIIDGLNDMMGIGSYDYVEDADNIAGTYTKVGFIYKTDKVTPILQLGHPYTNNPLYYKREYVQAFVENATNERFVLSMNHFKAKDGTGSASTNEARMQNVEHLVDFLAQQMANNYYQDPDVLILGDLNCSTQEEPILYLNSNGYENQLSRYAPSHYSYVYDNLVSYLDHVFASSSLSPQITGAAPYHINADESYKFHYPYGDTSMYRYADHDPIIVGLKLSSDDETPCVDISYSESFSSSLGNFVPINVVGTNSWFWYSNYSCAYMNGYNSGENEDWLISPPFNLMGKDSAIVEFSHTIGYGSSSLTWPQHCRLYVSSNYSGDVNAATWEQLPIQNMPVENWSWTANSVRIPDNYLENSSVVVAFRYTVESSDDCPAWEIKDFLFTAPCSTDGITASEKPSADYARAYGNGSKIVVEAGNRTDVFVYDLAGRIVEYRNNVTQCEIVVPQGFYIVRVDNHSYKIFIAGR